jgi:hypothetical protein
MLGYFWNGRGVGKKGMPAYLSDAIKDHALDFIGFVETMKKKYTQQFFRKIDPSGAFFWKWIPSIGRSGGILCGVRQDTLEVQAYKLGDFILRMDLWDLNKKCKWSLLVVYGAAQDKRKNEFLAEMSSFCNAMDNPYIIGGDFNILRHCGEKN